MLPCNAGYLLAVSREQSEWFENWTVQMRKGVLDMCILGTLLKGEWYGYALVKALVAIPGVGVAEGSIYPLLSRLRKQGLVTTRLEESTEGPARKYYCLTETGRLQAGEMSGYFEKMMKGVAALNAGEFTHAPSGVRGKSKGTERKESKS